MIIRANTEPKVRKVIILSSKVDIEINAIIVLEMEKVIIK